MVYVFLADGFEEIEAIAPIDILRRAGAAVMTVAVGTTVTVGTAGGKTVTGSHGVAVTADIEENSISDNFEMIVLPGGRGTEVLEKSKIVQKAIDSAEANGATIGAICAAPSILGHKGLLRGKMAVCYPGYENDLHGAKVMHSQVCEDGQIITGNGPGAAFEFGLALVKRLGGDDRAVRTGMLINNSDFK